MIAWDSLTDTEKVAQVRREVGAMGSRPPAHDWEEVVNDLTDDKNRLWVALNNIIVLWSIEAAMVEVDTAIQRGKIVLEHTRVIDS
jgi:hypothetical protein